MELLERYLWAVGKYLPEATRTDTIAELRANLLEQMDARAEELEQPLADTDVAEILKEHGRPEVVAARYLPQRSLIGPSVFPFYLLTLKRGLPFVLVVCALAAALEFVASAHESVMKMVLSFVGGAAQSCFFAAGIITLVFVGIEYGIGVNKKGSTWNTFDPYKLAEVPKERRSGSKSMTKRVVELVVHCLWMAWVISLPWKMVWHIGSGTIGINLGAFGADFGQVWHVFYDLLIALLSVQLAARLLALVEEQSRWIEGLDLAGHLLGILGLIWLVRGGDYLVAASTTTNLSDLAAANGGIGVALRVALVFALLGLGKKGWDYFRQKRTTALFAF